MTDDQQQVCMIFKTAYASQHGESFRTARNRTISCAGCTCDEGTTCDTQITCDNCRRSKTSCDADRHVLDVRCCVLCSHG